MPDLFVFPDTVYFIVKMGLGTTNSLASDVTSPHKKIATVIPVGRPRGWHSSCYVSSYECVSSDCRSCLLLPEHQGHPVLKVTLQLGPALFQQHLEVLDLLLQLTQPGKSFLVSNLFLQNDNSTFLGADLSGFLWATRTEQSTVSLETCFSSRSRAKASL